MTSAHCFSPRPSRSIRGLLTAAVALGGLCAVSTDADAGVTLLSRNSSIRAIGDTGVAGDGFDLSETTSQFSRFAERVGTETAVQGVVAFAHQYSTPGILGETGVGLEGAFAEGQVKSGVASAGSSQAQSNLSLLFEVDEQDSAYNIGASIGATGIGAVRLELCPVVAGSMELPLFAVEVVQGEAGAAGIGKSLEQKGLLTPGQYMLQVNADAEDTPGEPTDAEAYFTFNFELSKAPGSGGVNQPPVAVPLPPAVLGGGALLASIVAVRLRRARAR